MITIIIIFQEYLLASVRILRERGAAWVYLVYSGPSAGNNDEVSGVKELLELVIKMKFGSDRSSRSVNLCYSFHSSNVLRASRERP